jgi:3-phenylpropionate/trans-cinnamate dioxygenase ferredoxin subunit
MTAAHPTTAHAVCPLTELPPGEKRIVDIAGKSIGLFNVNGALRAVLNVCPHELAPICAGAVTGTCEAGGQAGRFRWGRDGEILRCPWHGWEFDLLTGEALADKRRLRLFDVTVEDGTIHIHL